MGNLYRPDPDPCVAAFNMVGALTMLVWDKQKDIHVLKALGAGNHLIRKIFLTEGVLLGLYGGIDGNRPGRADLCASVEV